MTPTPTALNTETEGILYKLQLLRWQCMQPVQNERSRVGVNFDRWNDDAIPMFIYALFYYAVHDLTDVELKELHLMSQELQFLEHASPP